MPDDTLLPDNTTSGGGDRLVLRPHWKTLAGPLLLLLLCVAGFVAAVVYVPAAGLAGHAHAIIAAFLGVIVVAGVVPKMVHRQATLYTLTSSEIRARHGLLRRRQETVPLHRVADLHTERTLSDRLFGSGTIVVGHSGLGDGLRLETVPHVKTVRHQIMAAADPDQTDTADTRD